MKRLLLLFGMLACWTSNGQLTAPVTESFDNSTLPTGWAISATSGGPWLFSGSTNSVFCTAAADNTGNSGSYAWMDQSGGDGGVILEMDTVDVSALTVPYLEFYYWMCGQGYTPFNVTIIEAWDGVSTWSRVDSITISTNGWQKLGFDISSFTYGNNRVKIRFRAESGGSTLDFYGDNALDDISVVEAPPCPPPSGFTVSNIQATTADLSWATSIAAGSWDVYWGTTGFDPQTSGSTANSTTNSYNITGLTGNTIYDAYLVADCGINGVSDTIGPLAFRTACVAEIVGYNNGFENDVINAAPLCWSNYISNSSATITVVGFSTPYLGLNHLRLNSGGAAVTDTAIIVSPQLTNLTSGLNQIRFFTQTDDVVEELIIGTVSNPANPGSFSAIDTIRYSGTFNYEEIIIPITTSNGYNGTDEYVAFKHTMNATFNGLFIDELNYEAIPPCPKITALNLVNVGIDSVTVSFNSSGTTTGYEWGPTGFLQGTGTTDTIQGNPITIGGLSPNTTYDLYVRNSCVNTGNGTSIWTGPITFTTACSALTAPYYENFESSNLGFFDGTDNCWSLFSSNQNLATNTSGYSWELRNAVQTSSGGTGASGDNTLYPSIGGQFFNADVSYGPSGDSSVLESPFVDISGLTTPELRYYLHRFGNNMAEFHVDIFDGTNWIYSVQSETNLAGAQTANGDAYTLYILDLAPYSGITNFKARFRTVSNGCCAGDNCLDDISIAEAPTCSAPSLLSLVNRTSNSIAFNWIGGGGAVATNIEYGTAGFTPGGGFTMMSTDTIDTISGLSSNTAYDIYIQDSCGASNGSSLWIGPLTVTTKCVISATTLPFFDGFENYTVGPYTGDNDFCNPTYIWEFAPQSPNGRLRFDAGIGFQKTGVQALTLDLSLFDGSAPANYLTLNLDLNNYTAAPGIELSFSVLNSGQPQSTENRVWVRGSQADPWIEVVDLDAVSLSGSFVDVNNIDIVAPLANAGQSLSNETQIRFGQAGTQSVFSTTCCSGFTFDDVSLVQVTCPTPSGQTAHSIVDTSATIAWNTSSSASSGYEVWFGPGGFFQGTQTTGIGSVTVNTTSGSILVDTLTSNTCYEYLIRYICGAGDTSIWVGPYTFCTPCSTAPIPYLEPYDAWPVACWDMSLGGQNWVVYNGPAGDNYAEAQFWSFNDVDMIMRSRPINITQDAWVRFDWSHLYSATYPLDQVILRAQVVGSSNWDTLVDLLGPTDFNDPTAGNTVPGSFITNTTVLDPLVYTGNTAVFELIANSDFGPDLFINNFAVEKIPTCFDPMNAVAVNIGFDDAELRWDQGATGQSGNYQVSYGAGITSASAGTMTMVSVDSLLLTGLTSNTNYCYYVREICGAGDSSNWTGPICFPTECTSLTAPFNEDFENSTLGHFAGKDNCWTMTNSNQNLATNTAGYSWELRNAIQTSSGGTGAAGDHTLYPAIGGQFYNADVSYGGVGDSSALTSPIIDITPLTNPELEYHYHRFGNNMGELHLDVYDGTNWIRGVHSYTGLVGAQTSSTDAWSDTILDLTPYMSVTNFQVRFRTVSNGCCAGDNGLDDIRISDPLSCISPQNLAVSGISATDATLLWDSGAAGQSGNYEVSYGLNLSDPLLGTTAITAAADSLALSTLSASSQYCFYVREICAVGDTSFWTGPFCFNTLCVAVAAPIFEDFENHTLGFFQGDDNCWTLINTNPNMAANTNGYSWELRNAVQTSSGGTGSVGDRTLFPVIGGQFFNSDVSYGATGDTSVLQSPIIDISGLTNPEVAYSLHRFGTNMGEFHVDVFDGTSWIRGVHSYTNLVGAQGANTAAWTDTAVSITAYAGITNFQVRFRTVSNGCCPGDNGLDDIHVRSGSACPDPTNLDTANVACNAADLLWNSPSSTLTSDVEWGAAGFTPGTGTSIVGATSPSTISGLSASTSYQFYVRDYCATDTSNWVGPFNFTTPACPPGCVDPNGLDTANASCTFVDLIWSSTPTTIASAVEWGAAGFTPGGGGTIVPGASSPESISGLTPGASYEFYVVDFCLTDTSNVVGPFAFTMPNGPITAAFSEIVNAPTLADQTVDFDAVTSAGATNYAWDFGDGNTGTTVNPSHAYTTNSSFTVKLVITGDCGIDSISRTVITAGISLTENKLGRSLEIYPNPTNGVVKVNFNAYNSNNAVISLTDLTGKVIRSTNVSVPNGKYEGELNIRDLARGSYILKIESGDLSVQRRVIKQ